MRLTVQLLEHNWRKQALTLKTLVTEVNECN
jgi:hypothetical protein